MRRVDSNKSERYVEKRGSFWKDEERPSFFHLFCDGVFVRRGERRQALDQIRGHIGHLTFDELILVVWAIIFDIHYHSLLTRFSNPRWPG